MTASDDPATVQTPSRTVRLVREEIFPPTRDDEHDLSDDDDADPDDASAAPADHDLLQGLPDDSDSIELINARLSSDSLLNLDLPRFALSLNQLCLRQNLITHLQPSVFSPLHALQDLDLYDNKLKDIDDALDNLPLTSLDLSFNLLRSIPKGISTLTHLTTLYFVQNKISHIDGLGNLGATLTSLELGGNRLRKIENLDALVNLEELWLGKNKIAKLENLHTLSKLKILSIQSNRLIKLEGLQALTSLRELYVSHNGIERIEGLDSNLELRTLDVGSNRISKIENISHLEKLEEFWASDNQIPNLHDLDSQLAKTASLDTIYLEGNPCQKLDMAGYRRKVILALPQVTQVDATHVKAP